jgi:protein arginine N-methyltransferase 1
MLDPNELFPEIPNLYEFPSVHAEMIYDERRVQAYKVAIERTVKKGDVVVDVGTGTGVLAFLSVWAGAKRVHAIDRSPVIEWARRLADANGLSDSIIFHNSDSRDTDIAEQADVIVSELIGHIAFEEGMVESLFDARRRLLKPGGTLIPESVTLFAAPVCEREVYAATIDRWKPAYGIDYSIMRAQALKNCYLTEIAERDLLAQHQPIHEVAFSRKRPTEIPTEISRRNCYRIHRSGEVNGVAMWFDATLAPHIGLSSGPWTKTHWLQCFTPVLEPVEVSAGDEVWIDIDMKLRSRREDRFTFAATVARG